MTNLLFNSIKPTYSLVVLLGLAITGIHAQIPDYVPTDGLVGWYPFDGNAEDESGLGNHGDVYGAIPGTNRHGDLDASLEFDGNTDYAEIAHSEAWNGLQELSISIWFHLDTFSDHYAFCGGGTGSYNAILHKWSNTNASRTFEIRIQDWDAGQNPAEDFYLNACRGYDDWYGCQQADWPNDMILNHWHHLVVVYGTQSTDVYVDGNLIHSEGLSDNYNTINVSSNPIRIGNFLGSCTMDGFDGRLDDLGFWNRTLTHAEIQGLFTSAAPIFGCTEPEACNYSAIANWGDESCQYPLIPGDCDAGSVACADGTYWNSLIQQCLPISCPTCPGDVDEDYAVGVSDLLFILSAFGADCPETGCTDAQATNYNPNVVINDGSCVYPPCLDAQEPGAACEDGNPNTFNTYWDEDGCLCEGSEYVAEDGSGPCEGALTVNYNGYDYLLVEIGDQCWFRENLRTENYTNGDSIPSGLSNSEWSTASFGASAIYGENPSNLETFGRLYNWLAVNDSRGLCPSGWHVPADSEWMVLEMTLGMSDSLVGLTGWRGTDQGTQIKSTYSWNNGGNGTNTSGFNAPPGGSRYSYNGGCYHAGDLGEWWSSSEDGTQGWFRTLSKEKENIRRNLAFKGFGFSVRCIVDDADTCFDPDGDGVCPEDEISGCIDETACNYNAEATHDDGSCIPSQEAGSSCDDGDDNTFNDAWDAETCVCAGSPAVAEDGSGPCEGALTVTYHGYEYQLVEIGDQCWFRENLRSLEFLNGDSIPSYFTDNFTHGQLAEISAEGPVVTTYTGDSTYLETIGALYNHRSISDERGLCPSGWRVPTDLDWAVLSIAAGMPENETWGFHWQGSAAGAGVALRDPAFYDGSNSTGFSAISAATFSPGGNMYGPASATGFWTTSQNGAMAWGRVLASQPGIQRRYHSIRSGLSVRCILGEQVALIDGGSCDDGLINTYDDTWYAETEQCQGNEAVAEDGSGPCEGQTFVSYHGVEYGLIEIEDQCWFRSNLQSYQFANGDSIPHYSSTGFAHGVLGALTAEGPAMAGYLADVDNIPFFGALYNFAVVKDERSICPTGWKVPDEGDWIELTGNLGMPESEYYHVGWKGGQDSVGFKMRAQDFMNGSNASGFSAVPSGYFSRNGYMYDIGGGTILWSKAGEGSMAWKRGLANHTSIKREMAFDRDGNSIRCLKASPIVNEPGGACDDENAATYNDAWDASGSVCAGIAGVAADGSGPCSAETAVVYHGVAYPLVEIGDQCWFRENLQSIQFANGDTIPNLFSGYSHGALGSLTASGPAMSAYGAQLGNLSHFGGMYNHAAAVDERGLCPTGWHVPGDNEWAALSAHLGMDESEWYNSNTWSGSSANISGQLREKSFANGQNGSGFSARGSGVFSISGYFYEPGQGGYYWTSSSDDGGAWIRILSSNVPEAIRRQQYTPESGMSVRCLLD